MSINENTKNASVNIDWNRFVQAQDAHHERSKRWIPPTDDDAKFLKATKHDKNWRALRVRPSVIYDHPIFAAGASPTGFITILDRFGSVYVVLADEARFGAVVDSDSYALMRIEALSHERKLRGEASA